MDVDIIGWIACIILVSSMLENKIKKLRIKNIIATSLYFIQSCLISSPSLMVTNLMLILVNIYKLKKI